MLETVRDKLDNMAVLMNSNPDYDAFVQNNPEQAFRNIGIYEESDNHKLYAWIPVPSLLCPTPANPRTMADCPTYGCPAPRPNK